MLLFKQAFHITFHLMQIASNMYHNCQLIKLVKCEILQVFVPPMRVPYGLGFRSAIEIC
jgi:hypothetical protein